MDVLSIESLPTPSGWDVFRRSCPPRESDLEATQKHYPPEVTLLSESPEGPLDGLIFPFAQLPFHQHQVDLLLRQGAQISFSLYTKSVSPEM